MVVTLLIVGLALLLVSAAGLSTMDRIEKRHGLAAQPCGMLSPDCAYQCVELLGHNGWCRDGDIEWLGDAWNIGWADQTAAAKPIHTTEEEPPVKSTKHAALVLLGVFGVVMLFGFSCGRFTAPTDTVQSPATPTGVVIDCGTSRDLRYFMTDGCPGQKKTEKKFGASCGLNPVNCGTKPDK